MPRTILITGGGTGIGRAVARVFAEQGENVIATGRRPLPLKELAAETGARAIVCDHTRTESLAELLTAVPGSVDVLVNNAGGNTDFDAEGRTDLDAFARDFRGNIEANLIGAALTTKALNRRLADGGAVVHIGSIAADQGAGSYGAAKAGLAAWNLDLAAELGRRDITANVVSPGYIAGTEFFRDQLAPERHDALVAATAMGRAGTPEDVAEAVAFLASPAARHITGQVLNINGGAHMTR